MSGRVESMHNTFDDIRKFLLGRKNDELYFEVICFCSVKVTYSRSYEQIKENEK